MKTLKLNHKEAQEILNGKRTTTWRLFDDKDISVNDVVQLLDKIDEHDSQTWKVIGIAKITKILEKQLGSSTENEYAKEGFKTLTQLMERHAGFYRQKINETTPAKIIHFNFEPKTELEDKDTTVSLIEAKIFADGGSRGNPGPSASGFVILDMDDRIVVKKGTYLGVTTNNQAEYQAVKMALEEARKLQIQTLHVYLDSLLVVNQMNGIYKIRNRDLWPIHASIKEAVKDFKDVSFTHVPRELNKLADGMVNETLDRALHRSH
ncbi:MAG TPA: reverse transcriptase-like protein [Candidatus Saccharimonadales bacterium]|nr:reverse transcriptase-like protein [Candidatus Saccharimonadales bacterium]